MAKEKSWESGDAQCCYYKKERRSLIVCQGLAPGESVHRTFAEVSAKRAHEKAYCYTLNYENCPIAEMLEKHQAVGVEQEDGDGDNV